MTFPHHTDYYSQYIFLPHGVGAKKFQGNNRVAIWYSRSIRLYFMGAAKGMPVFQISNGQRKKRSLSRKLDTIEHANGRYSKRITKDRPQNTTKKKGPLLTGKTRYSILRILRSPRNCKILTLISVDSYKWRYQK